MATQQLAEGLASLGRGKDTMLMHVTPKEVAGLQNLAMAHGGSLTINPQTGLPEAGFFDDILGAVAPIGLGMLLGPGGMIGGASGIFGMGALGAGLATGLAGFALSGGDLGAGLSAGLGGYGGAGLGKNLANFGATKTITEIPKSTLLGTSPLSSGAAGSGNAFSFGLGAPQVATGTVAPTSFLGSGTGGIAQSGGLSLGGNSLMGLQPQNLVGQVANTGAGLADDVISAAGRDVAGQVGQIPLSGTTGPVGFDSAKAGVGKLFGSGQGEGFGAYKKFLDTGYTDELGNFVQPSVWQDALTVASPLLTAGMKTPKYKIPEDTSYKMKYEGPYSAQDREPRTPTIAEQEALRAAGSPEYSYFGDNNPYPGFNKAPGYANGGLAQLYGNSDGTSAQNTLSEGYGLGRLNQMAQGGSPVYAGGGMIAFDAGGQIPNVGAIPNMGAPQMPQAGLPSMGGASVATGTNPMNPTAPVLGGTPGTAPQSPFQPKQQTNPIASTNTDPLQSMLQTAITDPMGRTVTKAMGGGIHSLAKGGKSTPGGYLDGEGDGMSDSIPATIGSKQPARLADGEFVIPADVVSHLGNGSTKAGAKHLYKMMDKVRRARTGNKKQGKQINPNKFVPA